MRSRPATSLVNHYRLASSLLQIKYCATIVTTIRHGISICTCTKSGKVMLIFIFLPFLLTSSVRCAVMLGARAYPPSARLSKKGYRTKQKQEPEDILIPSTTCSSLTCACCDNSDWGSKILSQDYAGDWLQKRGCHRCFNCIFFPRRRAAAQFFLIHSPQSSYHIDYAHIIAHGA